MNPPLSSSRSFPSWRFPVWFSAVVASDLLGAGHDPSLSTRLFWPLNSLKCSFKNECRESGGVHWKWVQHIRQEWYGLQKGEGENMCDRKWNGVSMKQPPLKNNFPFLRHQAPIPETATGTLQYILGRHHTACLLVPDKSGETRLSVKTDPCGSYRTRSGSILWRKRQHSQIFVWQISVETSMPGNKTTNIAHVFKP